MQQKGLKPKFHIAGDEEIRIKLIEKLFEEVGEFADMPSEEEMADIEEVIYSIKETFGLNFEKVSKIKDDKASERGRFSSWYILDL